MMAQSPFLTQLILTLYLSITSVGYAQECQEETLPSRPWYTGISSRMDESMKLTTEDGVHTDFHGIWMHSGWKNNLGPCAQSYPWTKPEYFQKVIDAGKIPVVYWWWHFDNPQSTPLRREAEQQLRDCLVPFLNEINRTEKEVWIVLQPEYNMQNTHVDPTFATHLITMIDELRANVTGVKLKIGPSPGNFGTVQDRYRLHPSLEGVLEKSDFIAFHDIQRSNPTTDAIWEYPVPGQRKGALSFCRFLHNEYHKPIFFAYWSVANQFYSESKQSEALKDIFEHQAEFERYGVFGFGPFWYQSEGSFASEGLKSTQNKPFQVLNDYREIVNNIADQKDYIHSIAFLDLDYGSSIELPIRLRWISNGRKGPITYSLYYQINDGERILISNNLKGSENEIMELEWEPCNFPTTPIMNFVLVADDGKETISPKVSYKNPLSKSYATYDFEDSNISSFKQKTSGVSFTTTNTAASGGKSLQVNLANNGEGWSYFQLEGPITYSGDNTLEMMIYVPYSLNNTMGMGEEVTYCTFYMQTTGTWKNLEAPKFGLNQGWNKVTWNYNLNGNDPQEINLLEIRFWNRMKAYNDIAKIYIDDLNFGDQNNYSIPNTNCKQRVTQLTSCTRKNDLITSEKTLNWHENNNEVFYPNPFADFIHFPNNTYKEIELRDTFGNTLLSSKGNIQELNTSSLPQGFYILTKKENSVVKSFKIVKN